MLPLTRAVRLLRHCLVERFLTKRRSNFRRRILNELCISKRKEDAILTMNTDTLYNCISGRVRCIYLTAMVFLNSKNWTVLRTHTRGKSYRLQRLCRCLVRPDHSYQFRLSCFLQKEKDGRTLRRYVQQPADQVVVLDEGKQ